MSVGCSVGVSVLLNIQKKLFYFRKPLKPDCVHLKIWNSLPLAAEPVVHIDRGHQDPLKSVAGYWDHSRCFPHMSYSACKHHRLLPMSFQMHSQFLKDIISKEYVIRTIVESINKQCSDNLIRFKMPLQWFPPNLQLQGTLAMICISPASNMQNLKIYF